MMTTMVEESVLSTQYLNFMTWGKMQENNH